MAANPPHSTCSTDSSFFAATITTGATDGSRSTIITDGALGAGSSSGSTLATATSSQHHHSHASKIRIPGGSAGLRGSGSGVSEGDLSTIATLPTPLSTPLRLSHASPMHSGAISLGSSRGSHPVRQTPHFAPLRPKSASPPKRQKLGTPLSTPLSAKDPCSSGDVSGSGYCSHGSPTRTGQAGSVGAIPSLPMERGVSRSSSAGTDVSMHSASSAGPIEGVGQLLAPQRGRPRSGSLGGTKRRSNSIEGLTEGEEEEEGEDGRVPAGFEESVACRCTGRRKCGLCRGCAGVHCKCQGCWCRTCTERERQRVAKEENERKRRQDELECAAEQERLLEEARVRMVQQQQQQQQQQARVSEAQAGAQGQWTLSEDKGRPGRSLSEEEVLNNADWRSPNPYVRLGLGFGATLGEIKRNYHRLALTYHPDRRRGVGQAEGGEAVEAFVAVRQAYEELALAHGAEP